MRHPESPVLLSVMTLLHTVREMQAHAEAARREGRRLALVPTMGALHEGHLELVRQARQHADHVTLSIFVNPTQFGPKEDFERYPRTLEEDLRRLHAMGGVDAVFAPSVAEMYPDGTGRGQGLTWVGVEQLDEHLCGPHRPGHFRGVATVVSKLFHICKPHVALFGLKDAQQFLILRRMAYDLNFDIDLVGVPTMREPDGLAMSSRNRYLTKGERTRAVVVPRAVLAAKRLIEEGETNVVAVLAAMRNELSVAPDARVQYLEVVETTTLQPVKTLVPGQEVLAAVAVYFSQTRLIDNAFARVPG